jgi:hypothetical protein
MLHLLVALAVVAVLSVALRLMWKAGTRLSSRQ